MHRHLCACVSAHATLCVYAHLSACVQCIRGAIYTQHATLFQLVMGQPQHRGGGARWKDPRAVHREAALSVTKAANTARRNTVHGKSFWVLLTSELRSCMTHVCVMLPCVDVPLNGATRPAAWSACLSCMSRRCNLKCVCHAQQWS